MAKANPSSPNTKPKATKVTETKKEKTNPETGEKEIVTTIKLPEDYVVPEGVKIKDIKRVDGRLAEVRKTPSGSTITTFLL